MKKVKQTIRNYSVAISEESFKEAKDYCKKNGLILKSFLGMAISAEIKRREGQTNE